MKNDPYLILITAVACCLGQVLGDYQYKFPKPIKAPAQEPGHSDTPLAVAKYWK